MSEFQNVVVPCDVVGLHVAVSMPCRLMKSMPTGSE